MRGTHKVVFEDRHKRYEFEIKHKFNIILGDSGSGKSYLCEKLRQGSREGRNKSRFKSDLVARSVYSMEDLFNALKNGYTLILVDENTLTKFCKGDAGEMFARAIENTGVYFIFMARNRRLSAIPIDVMACFRLKEQFGGGKSKYTLENLYHWNYEPIMYPDEIIIEDSKVGYQFYDTTLTMNECISAHGNSNIVSTVKAELAKGVKNIFVIADGCGFGVYFEELRELKDSKEQIPGVEIRYFFPPSFEYLVLKAQIFKIDLDILENTQNHTDVSDYFGWEAFYTDYLRVVSDFKYSKNASRLPQFLRDRRNQDKIYDVIEEIKP